MATTLYFPFKLMRESSHDWNIVGNTAVAGQSAASSVDIRSDGGGFWTEPATNPAKFFRVIK